MPRNKVLIHHNVGVVVSSDTGVLGHEQFTVRELSDLAYVLEDIMAPTECRSALRRLANLVHALQNDTDAFIITSEPENTHAQS